MVGLSSELRKLLSTSEPPYPGPEHRPGTLSIAEIDRQLKPLFNKASPTQQLISATLYLWHDHLDEAHSLAQEIETSDGSYVHGIMHRREPDYSNARYWFEEFHLDGLRLDATQQIFDSSREHIVAAIGRETRRAAGSRSIVLIAENEAQQGVMA